MEEDLREAQARVAAEAARAEALAGSIDSHRQEAALEIAKAREQMEETLVEKAALERARQHAEQEVARQREAAAGEVARVERQAAAMIEAAAAEAAEKAAELTGAAAREAELTRFAAEAELEAARAQVPPRLFYY
jgi:hypothetical protein